MRRLHAIIFVLLFNAFLVGGIYCIECKDEKTDVAETEAEVEEVVDDFTKAVKTAEIQCETVHFEVVYGAEVTTAETEPETEESTEAAAPTEMQIIVPKYFVNGEQMPEDLCEYLYNALNDRGIAWWMPYAVCQCYQESRFDIYAENVNGLDKGLFQFRTIFWDGGDIFDPYGQIEHYCNMVKWRMNRGRDTLTIISDHYTGEAGYSEQYVADVMQWMSVLEIREEEN